jgi:hypothetical protein
VSERKKYIVKKVVKQESIYHVEAWNPAHAKEVAFNEPQAPEMPPAETVVRVKLDAPPKEKKEASHDIVAEVWGPVKKKK